MFVTCWQAFCHSNKYSHTTILTKANFSLVLLQYNFLFIRTLFQHALQWNHIASWIQRNHHVIQIFRHRNRHKTIQSQHNFQGQYILNQPVQSTQLHNLKQNYRISLQVCTELPHILDILHNIFIKTHTKHLNVYEIQHSR